MYYSLEHLASLLYLLSFLHRSETLSSLGPPQFVPEEYEPVRLEPEKSRILLPCPVQSDPVTLFFEWYKNDEPLNALLEDRYRVQNNGALKIKSAVARDSGLYVCRAINGFGKLDTNVTLVVLAGASDENQEGGGKMWNRDSNSRGPRFINVTKTMNGILHRTIGGAIRLQCVASGDPEPQLIWLKNGLPLLDSSLALGSKRSRWNLYLRNLKKQDSGNYTCIAFNVYGHSNHTVAIEIFAGLFKKPELRGIHPINTTVEDGGSATFLCRVKSESVPHIQWLKQEDPTVAETEGHKVIKVHGEYFRILKSSKVSERSDGSFINKLIILGASERDTGKYLCLGANSMGYSFRGAFLSIHKPPKTYIDGTKRDDFESVDILMQYSPLFVIIPLSLGIFTTLLIAVALHYYHGFRSPRSQFQSTYTNTCKSVVGTQVPFAAENDRKMTGNHHALESSDGTWSHVQNSLVMDPGQPDSFSECDSSFVFLGDLAVYPNAACKDKERLLSLYASNMLGQDKGCLDRV